MSAFIVDDSTINRLVTFLNSDRTGTIRYHFDRLGYGCGDEQRLASDLFLMNCDSVDARYGKGTAAQDTEDMADEFRFSFAPCTAVRAYKDAQCLLYQCSEGDIDERPLYKALERTVGAIAHSIICEFPEYKSASWA